MLQWLVDHLGDHSLVAGYVFVFGTLVLCGFGLPMPEDVILVTGGVLAWLASPVETANLHDMVRDTMLLGMVFTGLCGIVAGDSVIYWMGRRYGARIAEHNFLRRIVSPEKLERVNALMRRRGNIVVVLARYLPGLRAPTYFTAGYSRLPYWEFLMFDTAAAFISAPLWVCLGFWFGDDIERLAHKASEFSHFILAAAVTVAALVAFFAWRRHKKHAPAGQPAQVIPLPNPEPGGGGRAAQPAATERR